MLSRAIGFDKDWNPHFAIYPAAQMYVQHAALIGYAALLGKRKNFRSAYASDNQARAYLVARRVSAAFGTATIPAIYFAGVASFGSGAALTAAAIAALSTIHVRESKYATTDVAAAFWITLTIAMILLMIRRGRYIDYAGAGFFAGLATATKYPAGAIVLAIATAHLGRCRRERRPPLRTLIDSRVYVAGIVAVTAFACTTPYTLLDWHQTLRDYAYQEGFVAHGVNNPALGHGWWWLLFQAMPNSFGLGLESLLLISLFWATFSRKVGALSMLTFAGVALVGMTGSMYVFYRYLIIPLPAMALLAGVFITDMKDIALDLFGHRRAAVIVAFTLGLLLAPSAVRDLQLNRLMLRTDTRTLARLWIDAHMRAGSAIAETDSTTPYGKPQLGATYRVVPLGDIQALTEEKVGWILSDSFGPLSYYSPGPSERELSMLNSKATLLFDTNPIIYGAPRPIYDPNDAFYVPLQHITSVRRPGPRIRIWKLQ